MSGHSKWSNIKRRKGASDAAKAKVFTKIGREIAVAVKMGGADPNANSRLRDAIAKAKSSNMPNDNIARGIKKAAGELNNINYENIVYEGYGAGGVAVIVECLTDNKNRTAGEVRHIFDKFDGSMGTTNCVSFMFDLKGIIVLEKRDNMDYDDYMESVLMAGGDDFSVEGDYLEVITQPNDLNLVKTAMEESGFVVNSYELTRVPQNYTDLTEENLVKVQKMLDRFEDNDDVQNVYHNANLPEEDEEE